MVKYYTRACNFFYGYKAKNLIKTKNALPLCGNNNIAFDKIEIIKRNKGHFITKKIHFKNTKNLTSNLKTKIQKDIIKITKKRKKFFKNLSFLEPSIMGILNLTPDSFSDGGKFDTPKKARKHISEMINNGAKIIDVGGESTRPGSKTVPVEKEWNRIKKVIKNFKKKFGKTLLSIDTRKSSIMSKSLKFKADIINDVSGFNYDKNSLPFLKKNDVVKVVHHMQGTPLNMQKNPRYKNVLLDIYDFFENNIEKLENKKIILDPGIGFGKNLKHNLTLISNISLFHSLGFPILVGTSRKRFISQISGKNDSKERIGGTIASILFLLLQGVQLFRVHNVKEVHQSVLVFNKILSNSNN